MPSLLDSFVYENHDGRWWACVVHLGGYRSLGPFTTYIEARNAAKEFAEVTPAS